MLSANQLYKKSKTDLTFKQWLKDTQSQGVLDNHQEPMFNANGDEEIQDNSQETSASDSGVVTLKLTTKKAKSTMGSTNIIGLLGLGLLIFGITRTKAE